MKLNFNSKGQALVEYVLIIALIAGIAVYLTSTFGGILRDKITEASCNMMGESYVEGEKKGEGYCK